MAFQKKISERPEGGIRGGLLPSAPQKEFRPIRQFRVLFRFQLLKSLSITPVVQLLFDSACSPLVDALP
jgi:hypothetical protein